MDSEDDRKKVYESLVKAKLAARIAQERAARAGFAVGPEFARVIAEFRPPRGWWTEGDLARIVRRPPDPDDDSERFELELLHLDAMFESSWRPIPGSFNSATIAKWIAAALGPIEEES